MKIQHEYIEQGIATIVLFTISGILARTAVKIARSTTATSQNLSD